MVIIIVLCVYVMYNVSLNSLGTDIKKANSIVSGEGEGTEEAIKVVVSGK